VSRIRIKRGAGGWRSFKAAARAGGKQEPGTFGAASPVRTLMKDGKPLADVDLSRYLAHEQKPEPLMPKYQGPIAVRQELEWLEGKPRWKKNEGPA
jgi:hypothetical protein